MEKLTIGKVAKKAKVNIQTIRYYERIGLIPSPLRSEAGYRKYSYNTIMRIQFIKRAKELGFSLKEISELLSLRISSGTKCGKVKRKAEKKVNEIEEKIQVLKNIKSTLLKLISTCSKRIKTSECPILDALQSKKRGNDE